MIKFLLVDDDSLFLENLTQMIRAQCKLMKRECIIESSTCFKDIENKSFDFLFLDIDLNENEDGISIAKKLKKENRDAKIIFITSHDHLVHDTLKVQPFYFVRKKFINVDLPTSFLLINEYYSHKNVFSFYENGRSYNIYTDDILYLETSDHLTTLYTTYNKHFYFYKTLQQVLKDIDCNDIYRIHKKYSVNIKHILFINKDTVQMVNGISIPIGRTYKKKFEEIYDKYVSMEEY